MNNVHPAFLPALRTVYRDEVTEIEEYHAAHDPFEPDFVLEAIGDMSPAMWKTACAELAQGDALMFGQIVRGWVEQYADDQAIKAMRSCK